MDGLSIVTFNHTWFKSELEALGHRVFTVGHGRDGFDLTVDQFGVSVEDVLWRLPFDPSHLVFFDDSRAPWTVGLERVSLPKLFLSVDTHHHSWWHDYYGMLFDRVIYAQPGFAPDLENWFPLWCNVSVKPESEKSYEAIFRGNLNPSLHPKRAKFFKQLQEYCSIDVATGDWTTVFPRAKIVVNQAIANEVNFRVFEAMLSGALLLNPRGTQGMDLLFEEDLHYVGYEADNPEDCANRINELLKDEERRSRIANAGYELVSRNHTAEARAKDLVEILRTLRPRLSSATVHSAAFMTLAPSLGDIPNLKFILAESVTLAGAAVADERFPQTDREANSVMFLLNVLLNRQQYEELLSLSTLLAERFDNLEYKLFQIAAFIGKGDRDRAFNLASSLSDKPEEFIAVIPSVLGGVLSKSIT